MKYYLIVNPVSGNRKGVKKAEIVSKLLLKNGIESKTIISTASGEITRIVSDIAKNEVARFYIIGGDGSFNEAVCGLIGSESEVIVLPCGSGNDFVRTISDYKSLRKIVLESLKNDVRKVDIIKLSIKDKYSINILNAGFDATVAFNMNKFRKVPFVNGSFKYNLAIFYTLFRNKNYRFKIRVDNKVFKGKYTLIAIANGKYYGGGICPAKDAVVDDGLLDICIVERTSLFRKIVLLPKYKKGKHTSLKEVTMIRGKNITVVSNDKFQISLDGEILETNKFKCSLLDKRINVVFTKK